MYISELRISNFRCFDGTEHIIRFNKGLSVLGSCRMVVRSENDIWTALEFIQQIISA